MVISWHKTTIITSRRQGSCHQPTGRYIASGCLYSNQDNGLNDPMLPPQLQSSQTQRMETIHIPMALAAGPFLQHTRLTPGQKRYLCSIANTEHVRRVMQQHYLNVLHRCTKADHCPFKESIREELNMSQRASCKMDSDRTTNSTNLSGRTSHSDLAAVHSGRIVLPKIRKASTFPASKERISRKPKSKVPMAQTSVRGKDQ
ncbi:hypothetical protein AAFF_G00197330 [Aldrovandia affinis]|uniref:Protein FAM216A n=1 Tax=Aldrovandia affinis TaxID=143900 RepID=A0AAD7RIW3_9TELE|nr:hypothetical protein AAFF_G00197330 [Aldrovandia affinis]